MNVRMLNISSNIQEGVPKDLRSGGMPSFSDMQHSVFESFLPSFRHTTRKPFLGNLAVRLPITRNGFLSTFNIQLHRPMQYEDPLVMSRLHIQNFINLALELLGQSLFVSNDPGVIIRSFPPGRSTLTADRFNILHNGAWHSVALRKQ